MRRSLWVAALVLLAACSNEAGVDAGPPGVDSGVPMVDAGDVPDAGTDAAEGPDSGPTDAGADAGGDVDAGPDDGSFTYLTMNLWNAYLNSADWDARRAMIADGIRSWSPDAVCLQEVVATSSLENGATALATATGYRHHYVQTHDTFLFEEGIAVLARHPIVATDSVRLPITDLGIAMRTILSADLDTPRGIVRVFCSHMSIDTDETNKAGESVAAFGFMDTRRTEGASYFAGDLNAEPDTLAMRVLRGEAMHTGVTGDLVDAWIRVNPSDPGYTIPSDGPDRRIDYVYVVPGSTAALPTIDACEQVFTTPAGGVYASDHIGVRCTFTP